MDSPRWRLNRLTHLHWRRLDDEWVVFDSGSADTHQFDSVSAATLMCFESGPHDLDGLIEVLASELDLPAGERLSSQLESLIEQLSTLGLIEPVET
jgi:PqqD family protein of HPr-rel-A system